MGKVIQLISGPRNISTALMYSFRSRPDTTVLDEPFYAYYLTMTGVDHPGKEATLRSMNSDPKKVTEQINGKKNGGYLFIKNMAHHLYGLNIEFIKDFRNIVLIRNPRAVIRSFSKVIPRPTLLDIGIKLEFEIFHKLIDAKKPVVVLDSDELLKDPKNILEEVCRLLDIPFYESMLKWDAGPKPEDGVWAEFWYTNAHKSTGFQTYKKEKVVLPNHLIELYEEALPFYRFLYERSLKA